MESERKLRVLVIDDQIGKPESEEMAGFLLDYRSLLSRVEFVFSDACDSAGCYTSEAALAAVRDVGFVDLVLLDIKFGTESDRLGFEILERLRGKYRSLPIAMMTSLQRDVENLSRSLEPGAVAFIGKRPQPEELERRIRSALALARDHALLGGSSAMRTLRREIARISPYDSVPVLILGERGTGKERVARNIHHSGPRRDGPFVGLNCAGLSPDLLEAELFGHEKGAFTGAERARKGYLELASGGTLFLDEVGDIPIPVQVKLLRVLEEKEFSPVGGAGRPGTLNVQLLAATNADVAQALEQGRLREDFFDRIAAFQIRTPSLREYPEDIPELADYFLGQMISGGRPRRFAIGALDAMKAYLWPGNGRELRNVVWRAAIKAGDAVVIGRECLPETIALGRTSTVGTSVPETDMPGTEGVRWPERGPDRANFLSEMIIDTVRRQANEVDANAAAILRDLFPGQVENKRYLGQIAWKLVDWNPRLLSNPRLREKFESCTPLWSALVQYLSASPLSRRKILDKLRRYGVAGDGL